MGGAEVGAAQDAADGGRADLVPEAAVLTVDAPESPTGDSRFRAG